MPAAGNQPPYDQPPSDAPALALWFSEAVRSEVAALEKDSSAQSYELLSGKLIETVGPREAIFQFVMADAVRLPEDATGRLKTEGQEYSASIIGQEANLIALHIAGDVLVPPGIYRATLVIDDTALLRKLAEILEQLAQSPSDLGPLAARVFHPSRADLGHKPLPQASPLAVITGELRSVLVQACGSSITYIWGPPGTGKTYAIARLVAALIANGERVLVTSHTHAAVDAAVHATVNPDPSSPGPLGTHSDVIEGRVLRIGRTVDPRVPDSVRLDKVMERRAGELNKRLSDLEESQRAHALDRAEIQALLTEWHRLAELRAALETAREEFAKSISGRVEAEEAVRLASQIWLQRGTELEQAQHAWIRRGAKTQRAQGALQSAWNELRTAEDSLLTARGREESARPPVESADAAVHMQELVCKRLPDLATLELSAGVLDREIDSIQQEIQTLRDAISRLEQELIAAARVVFCTLTKMYVGRELEQQRFDAVIIDEISMALPPLVFLAASRGTRRVTLVGDFLQLPPIVRSDSEVSNARLREDTFHLAGVAEGLRPSTNCPVLARLITQRRMAPMIADVARDLAYGVDGIRDDASVLRRQAPAWLDFLPPEPLVIVDTAGLHCWSGKQARSLSRFNFYSATLGVELAAMAAANLPEPAGAAARAIGIVTPFAAQRRLLARRVAEMELGRWVSAGTVHAFQGSEAEFIIFDSVLDEPYFSARLCDPRSTSDVVRELNVAVTRARSKFVFIGSSEWLNQHARPASGLGQLWSLLKDRAPLIAATDLVERGFLQRVSDGSLDPAGWRLPETDGVPTHEILDEASFFPRFTMDVNSANQSIFGLVPYFGQYRWPTIQPLLAAALARGVEVTLVTPPLAEASGRDYVENAIRNLRSLGAVVVSASGLHGKDIVIDERVHYTGSLNWASHRGRAEIMHRTDSPAHARLVLLYMQARYIRRAAEHEDRTPRVCPRCGGPIQVVNQRRQHGAWDVQALKVGCANPACQEYLRDIDERPPYKQKPRCRVDGTTDLRRVARGKGEIWRCPKHPKEWEKVVPGDTE